MAPSTNASLPPAQVANRYLRAEDHSLAAAPKQRADGVFDFKTKKVPLYTFDEGETFIQVGKSSPAGA